LVPFKSNSLPGEPGSVLEPVSIWEPMYAHFLFNRPDFLKGYQARSNAENALSAIKARFRDNVLSQTNVALRNEVLLSSLDVAHRICTSHVLSVSEFHLPVGPALGLSCRLRWGRGWGGAHAPDLARGQECRPIVLADQNLASAAGGPDPVVSQLTGRPPGVHQVHADPGPLRDLPDR